MTTAILNLLNKPLLRRRDGNDSGDGDPDEQPVRRQGIVLQPWMISLLMALLMNLMLLAVMWGTIVTRIDSLGARMDRLERVTDSDRERTRGVQR